MDIQLKQNNFQNTVENNQTVLVDFYADWCGPCQTLLPTIEKLAEEYEGNVAIKKVNVDNNKELASSFGIRSIPTLVYISKGKEVTRQNGIVTERELRNQIELVKAI